MFNRIGLRMAKQQSMRAFSTAAEQHMMVKELGNGIVLFDMNRPKARNALSRLLVNQMSDAITDYNSARCILLMSSTSPNPNQQ